MHMKNVKSCNNLKEAFNKSRQQTMNKVLKVSVIKEAKIWHKQKVAFSLDNNISLRSKYHHIRSCLAHVPRTYLL